MKYAVISHEISYRIVFSALVKSDVEYSSVQTAIKNQAYLSQESLRIKNSKRMNSQVQIRC